MLPTKFGVNWLLGLGEEVKNRFSRWLPWRPSWISDRNDFSYFWSISHPNASYQVWSQLAFGFRMRSENSCQGVHLGFLIGTILAIFDLQVTPMLPSKFGVNWPFGSGEEVKNRFSRWRPWQPSWISDRNDFSYFLSTRHPDASYQVSSQLAQGCRRSRLSKELLTPHDGHWLTTIAHHEHFVLRWAKNYQLNADDPRSRHEKFRPRPCHK